MDRGDPGCRLEFPGECRFFRRPRTILSRRVRSHRCTEQQANGTLLNYIDQPDSFADSASTALMAATTFRFANIMNNSTHIQAATLALQLVQDSINDQGWLL